MSLQHPECYGQIFPDLDAVGDEPKGRVFSIKYPPVMGSAKPRVEARVNFEQWDQCRKCEEFPHCLDLSTTKLVFQAAVWQI